MRIASESRARKETLGGAITQPLRDVSLLREPASPVLAQAMAAPYALPASEVCPAIIREITELDAVLGPDLDKLTDQQEPSVAAELATSAIGDVVGLPFRGLVRRMSGAARHDKELADAVLAGMVRRGFLKGVAAPNQCFQETGQSIAAKTSS